MPGEMIKMNFDNNYHHPLDRDYLPDVSSEKKDYGFEMNRLGISHGVGRPLLGLEAQIKAGASIVELGFSGSGEKSSGDSFSPERISKTERREIKELADINKVKVTVHSSWAVDNTLSGFNSKNGKFSGESSKAAIDELKRAVDFASDATHGGPVVVHVGEWNRPIRDISDKYGEPFEGYPNEKKTYTLVNEKTGEVYAPMDNEDLVRYAEKRDSSGNIMFKDKGGMELEEINLKDNPQEYIKHYEEGLERKYEADKRRVSEELKRTQEELIRVRKRLGMSSLVDKNGEPLPVELHRPLYPSDVHETEFSTDKKELERRKDELEEQYEWQKREALSAAQGLEEHKRNRGYIKPIEEVSLNRAANNIADAAMYALAKSEKTENPIFIAPENIFSGQYGSHPQELKDIILESRKSFREKLKHKGYSSSEAEKLAEQHIRATFDIGHANTWRKYFKGSDKEFNKWVLDEVKKLKKDNIIGHVHVSDNFGYGDEHLSAGEGNTPIKEFLEEMKDTDVVVIAEGGGQQGDYFDTLTALWGQQRNPIYSIGRKDAWSNIEGSYFGNIERSSYLVGKAAPSKDWQIWSKTPLE